MFEKLWEDYKTFGLQSAKDQLIIEYVKLVKNISGRLFSQFGSHVEYDDLVGYGIIGLIDAIEKFDHKKDVKFETYASIRIRGAIIDQIRNLDWIPRNTRQKQKKVEEAINTLHEQYGLEITDEMIANHLGITKDEYSKLLSEVAMYSVVSIEDLIAENTHFDISDSSKEYSPVDVVENAEIKAMLSESIEKLTENERKVVELYYYSDLTYKEIAAVLAVSESRISQIHSKAMIKMRAYLVRHKGFYGKEC